MAEYHKLAGKAGGHARARKLSSEQRKRIASSGGHAKANAMSDEQKAELGQLLKQARQRNRVRRNASACK